jgi:DUF971 family protein
MTPLLRNWQRFHYNERSSSPLSKVESRFDSDGRYLTLMVHPSISPQNCCAWRVPLLKSKVISESERKTIGGKRNVTILSVDPVGNYAVRLGFDDMHTTGIFSWAFLHEIGRDAGQRFQSYLDDLAAKGLHRDKPGAR